MRHWLASRARCIARLPPRCTRLFSPIATGDALTPAAKAILSPRRERIAFAAGVRASPVAMGENNRVHLGGRRAMQRALLASQCLIGLRFPQATDQCWNSYSALLLYP